MTFCKKLNGFLKENKNKLNKKVQITVKNKIIKTKRTDQYIELSGCLLMDFYFEGEIYYVGTFVDFVVNKDEKKVLDLKRTNTPYLLDQSAINLNDNELALILKNCIEPMFINYIDHREIPYLEERMMESISPLFFEEK